MKIIAILLISLSSIATNSQEKLLKSIELNQGYWGYNFGGDSKDLVSDSLVTKPYIRNKKKGMEWFKVSKVNVDHRTFCDIKLMCFELYFSYKKSLLEMIYFRLDTNQFEIDDNYDSLLFSKLGSPNIIKTQTYRQDKTNRYIWMGETITIDAFWGGLAKKIADEKFLFSKVLYVIIRKKTKQDIKDLKVYKKSSNQ